MAFENYVNDEDIVVKIYHKHKHNDKITSEDIGELVEKNIVDAFAIGLVSTPAFAFVEKTILGMSNYTSWNMREIAVYGSLTGIALAITSGRNLYRASHNITDTTEEKIQQKHDNIYNGVVGAIGLVLSPIACVFAGIDDYSRIFWISLVETGAMLATVGSWTGYSIDFFENLNGIKKSARVPEYIQNKSYEVKLWLAATITAASVILTTEAYRMPQNFKEEAGNTFYTLKENCKKEISDFVTYYYGDHVKSDMCAKPTKP